MTQVPLSGEQSALLGFRWQYDHIARLVYDAIVDSDFDKLILASTDAGQVDDLLLFLGGRRQAIQYKGGLGRATVTFSELVRAGKTRSGRSTDSLWRALARGWHQLERQDDRPLIVHLAMAVTASTSDHVTAAKGGQVSPDHLRAFLARGLEPLMSGAKGISDLPEWSEPLERLQQESGLTREDFTRFLTAVRLDLGLGEALDGATGTRADDILNLSQTLMRTVSSASGPVELSRDDVLTLMNWKDRKSFHSVHEFPINPATYSPLIGAATLLHDKLAARRAGYIAVTGAPGAGKSTLLSQTLSELPDRVVRYYAFVPGAGSARSRLSAEWFLHDLSTMLSNAGLQTGQKQLPGRNVHDLRQSVQQQFDAASTDHANTGRRTIVVVDGLDHVQRDYTGHDALTAELPKPADLPDGVIFLVGTRDLTPLSGEARQHIEDENAEINLEHQRLGKTAVIDVCRRFDATRTLPSDVHALIAEHSGGHPLSLVYLLAQIEDYTGEDPEAFVRAVPQYDGDIAAQYRVVWDSLDAHGDLERVLRICSRLRIGFDLTWMRTWASDSTTRQFRTQLRYLFRVENGRWRFFHDSFRQYARERTSIGDQRTLDPGVDREAHSEVAEICEASPDTVYDAQALFHRYQAGELGAVLRLGTQARFRAQFQGLRPAADITEDAKLMMMAAAQTADFPALLRGLLVLSEVSDRTSEIDEVDVCQMLVRSGMVALAIDYVGDEQALRVPLAQAYNLAADLAAIGNPAGERVFGLFQHYGLEEPGRSMHSDTETEIAQGWARCAANFLPLETALSRMRVVLPTNAGEREWEFSRDYGRFDELMSTFIQERGVTSADTLNAIDAALAEELQQLGTKGLAEDNLPAYAAVITNLRLQAHTAFLRSRESFEEQVELFTKLRAALKGMPARPTALLSLAMLEGEYGSTEVALERLRSMKFDRALTVSELGAAGRGDALANHYDYWVLRHKLEIGLELRPRSFGAGPIPSVKPQPKTPAGDDVVSDAPLHRASGAIELASRIDLLVRHIALAEALVASGVPVGDDEAWEALSVVINLFPPSKSDHDVHGLRGKRKALHLLAMDALHTVNPALLDRYERTLARRFDAEPLNWPASLRVMLGVRLANLGVTASWLSDALATMEAEASEQGVGQAMVDLVALVDAYADLGDPAQAARICRRLWGTSFGLGSRSDYQLQRWVQWLGRAAPHLTDLEDQATWLARVIAAAEPLTDQSVGGAELPGAIASTSPRVALATFEYLVAHGAVHHTAAMAGLLTGLLSGGTPAPETVRLAADITSGILAAASTTAHPELAEALARHADTAVLGNLRRELCTVALESTRATWMEELFPGGAAAEEEDEFRALKLRDGTKLTRTEVNAAAMDLGALQDLLTDESEDSYFDWRGPLDANFTSHDRQVVVDVFASTPHYVKVLVWAAEGAHTAGHLEQAQQFAATAHALTSLEEWTSNRDALRQRAIRILVVAGAMTPSVAAADFVRFVVEERWYSYMLNTDIDGIFEAIGADTSDPAYWATVREYLDGLAENLILPAPVSPVPALKWWIQADLPGRRSPSTLTPTAGVAELAVMHLTHPAWPVREGAQQVVVAALMRGSVDVVDALTRLVDVDPTEDVLETVAACIAAAGRSEDAALAPVMSHLTAHSNLLVRRLVTSEAQLRAPRALPAVYRLHLHVSNRRRNETLLGNGKPFLAPFEGRYAMLAELSGLDPDTLLAVAGRYATTALASLPDSDAARAALIGANMRLTHPSSLVLAARSAFGHVLADLVDAGETGNLPDAWSRYLRTDDIGLCGRRPDPMPSLLPAHPPPGHDQTPEAWVAAIEERMDEYIDAAQSGIDHLVGACSEVFVPNWSQLEEQFTCDLVPRDVVDRERAQVIGVWVEELSQPDALPEPESVLVENNDLVFMERRAAWVALHPHLASRMGWRADPALIGGWRTPAGLHAAMTTIWTNGTWGRAAPLFDDVVSEGCAVVLTVNGLEELRQLVGPLDVVFTVTRADRKRAVAGRTITRRIEL